MNLKSIEKQKWMESQDGKRCVSGQADGKYLRNRIDTAWDAAWNAVTANNQIILGALDSLGTALAAHSHTWTDGEKEIYEQAVAAVTNKPIPSEDA